MSHPAATPPNYWVIVGSKENYDISKARGFTIQGIKSRHQKKAALIQPGDYFIYYLTGLKVLGGIVRVCSPCIEDDTPIWTCSNKRKEERYPFRFKIEPYLIPVAESGFVEVTPLHGDIDYLKKWPEKNWTLGFQGNVHHWPESDFRKVEALFRKVPTQTVEPVG